MAKTVKDENTLARQQWERYMYMLTAGHEDFIKVANENEGFYDGDGQWEKQDRADLEAEGRPCETINQILPKVNNILGEQIAARNEITTVPRDNVEDPETSKVLNKVLKHVQQTNRFDDLMTDVYEDGVILGRGFLEFTMEFPLPGMPGNIKVTQKHPKTILIDPHSFSYDPEDWNDFMETRWMSYNDIRGIFGKKKADDLEAKQIGNKHDTYGFDSIRPWSYGGEDLNGRFIGDNEQIRDLPIIRVNARQFREWDTVRYFVDPATRDTSEIPREWDDDRAAFVANTTGLLIVRVPGKRIRHRMTGDSVTLFDKWSIYRSFSVVPFYPMFRWGKPIAVVTNLKGPQRVVNKMSSQELHILNTTANSGWIAEEDSLVNMDADDLKEYGSQSGFVIEFKKGSTPPEKIKPNQMSQAHDRLSFIAKENIKDISTINDTKLGNDREDVAAKAIVAKQQRSSINLKRYESNEGRTMYFAGRKMVELIQAFYTEPRILRITGNDPLTNAETSEDVRVNQRVEGKVINDVTIGTYDVVITNTPSRDNLQEAQFEESVKLRELGVGIPDPVLIRNSSLDNKAEIAEAMSEDPHAQKMKEAELLEKQMDIVDTFASARKKDADANAVLQETNSGGEEDAGPSKAQQFQTDRLINLLKAAQAGEIKRLTSTGDTNAQSGQRNGGGSS